MISRDKPKKKREHRFEVAGWILTITAAFLFLCATLQFILGPVSRAIAGFLLGTFGFSIYPLLLSAIVFGIFIIKGVKPKISRFYAISIAAVSLLLIFILHLATTFSILGLSFTEYSGRVFTPSAEYGVLSAGGVTFGTVAFGLAALITPAAAFVFLSLGILTLVFFMLNRRFALISSLKKRRTERVSRTEEDNVERASKGNNSTEIQPLDSLFGERIVQPDKNYYPEYRSDSGDFSQLKEEKSQNTPSYSAVVLPIDSPTSLTEPDEDARRKESLKELLGDPKMQAPYFFSKEFNSDANNGTASIRPKKTVEPISLADYGLEELVQIPQKDENITYKNFTGIIDADKVSFELEKTVAPPVSRPSPLTPNPSPLTPNPSPFNTRRLAPTRIASKLEPLDKPQPAIEPNSFDNAIFDAPPATITPALIPESKRDFEKIITSPIIDADSFLVEIDTPEISEPEVKFENQSFIEEEFSPIDTVCEDEVEDLTLSRPPQDFENDFSGYVEEHIETETEKPSIPRTRRSASNKLVNQVGLETYMQEVAELNASPRKKRRSIRYNAPPIELLEEAATVSASYDFSQEGDAKSSLLEKTLEELSLPAKVTNVVKGPAVNRYELEMPPGIPIKKITQLVADIEYYLASNGKVRLETPIPGRRAVGIEVPNDIVEPVPLREILESKEFSKSNSPLAFALGKDIGNSKIVCDLSKMPHMLIAGTTGSGKSVCLNSIIMSLVFNSSPEDVRLILVDPKRVEFSYYKGLPHLLTEDVICDDRHTLNAFKWLRGEMEQRYMLFNKSFARNIDEYNKSDAVKRGEEDKLPYIVLIVDEVADLMLSNHRRELEENISSIAQKARAAGIHLILATQRPSVNVISGTIKSNLPSRIAFSLRSAVDSRTILDMQGAETLVGKGDMLYAPLDADDPKRIQGAWVDRDEVVRVVNYIKEHNEAFFDEDFESALTKQDESESKTTSTNLAPTEDDLGYDPLLPSTLKQIIEKNTCSTSFIQRVAAVGYSRAARMVDYCEAQGYVGPASPKGREIRISMAEWESLFSGE